MEVDLSILDDLFNAKVEQKVEVKEEPVKRYIRIERDKEILRQAEEVYKKYQENIKVSEHLRAEINKETDIKAMCEKALRCIALMTGDEVFYKNNIRKLEA